jgi:peroxiredoxin
MQADLDEHGVNLVALSKDTVEEAATHKIRDGLSMTLLADPKLDVIRQYGVEHHKALGFNTGSFAVFGIPLALTPSFKTMAIPTSLLVDENGVIRWIDQTDDYRLRSSNERVLQAVSEAFD